VRTTPSSIAHAAAALLVCGIVVPAPAIAQTPAPAPNAPVTLNLVLQDFRQLVSTDSAAILSIGGIAAAVGHMDDRRISAAMSGANGLDETFGAGETIGGARMQAAGAVAAYAVGRMTSNPALARLGGDLIRAQIVAQTLTAAVKTTVGRTRPDGTRYSFPSGHAAVTFASATVLQRNLGWKAGIPAYAVAGWVAASRIQVKRHFLSDVTFGAALGITAGRAVTIGRGDHRFALAPAAVPGGGAVSLTWIGRP
jgi:membrane-associated phospholipid phosphatase